MNAPTTRGAAIAANCRDCIHDPADLPDGWASLHHDEAIRRLRGVVNDNPDGCPVQANGGTRAPTPSNPIALVRRSQKRIVLGCGMNPERQASEVVADFAAGADRLQAMAKDWSIGQFRHHDVTNADAILRGLAALLIELRTQETNDD